MIILGKEKNNSTVNIESSFNEYDRSLQKAILWLVNSIDNPEGGSRAYFLLPGWWQKAYPETTGYIIPTLINYSDYKNDSSYLLKAESLGNWLLSIQDENGYWISGFHLPKDKDGPSVFNTGQILFGLVALYNTTGDKNWLEAAERGAQWLAESVSDVLWKIGHYTDYNPTYYSRVAWPMLEVAQISGNNFVKKRAVKVLDVLINRKNENGTFHGWGFKENEPAYTHTIAYTIRGFLEASIIINDWERFGGELETTMDKIYKLAELNNGRLAGAYDSHWNPQNYYTCPTGNAQLALCLMRWHEQQNDLRLINAASKLIDNVMKAQVNINFIKGLRGAIPGSKPVWGRYMILRYPNWAAKFYADSLMLLIKLVKSEIRSWNTEE